MGTEMGPGRPSNIPDMEGPSLVTVCLDARVLLYVYPLPLFFNASLPFF